jgi:SAM-dependent methyltransferase
VNANKELWEQGDFTRIAAATRASGEALVADLGITPGLRVLDLGSGDGTTALPAARLGAEVLGVDIAANLVAAGRERAAAEGLDRCRFVEGDACALASPDASFDLVLSVFGAMFAPCPVEAASEMVRVARPGGRIVMANWIPGDPTVISQMLRIAASYSPPPSGAAPVTWGDENTVRERFAAAGIDAARIGFSRRIWTFTYPGSPSELLGVYRAFYGPVTNAYAAAGERADELHRELTGLFAGQNTAEDPAATVFAAAYLLVTVDA